MDRSAYRSESMPVSENEIFGNCVSSIVGMDGVIKLSDRRNLPYTEAVIFETLRLYPVAPCALPHKTDRDSILRKYESPQLTT